MDGACLAERAHLTREGARHADAERRTWSFTLQIVVALALFAFAPRVPNAHHLFGALTTKEGLCVVAPGSLAAVVSLVIYKRFGPASRTYVIAETIESMLLYGINVAVVFLSELSWPVVWILCPFTAVFWAVTKPYEGRVYLSIMLVAHSALALAYVWRGDAGRAFIALGVLAASSALFAALAREGRKNITLEAERNVARAMLDEAMLDSARRRAASALRDGIGLEIKALARELESRAERNEGPEAEAHVKKAHSALSELAEIADAEKTSDAPSTLAEIMWRVDDKCRPLCAEIAYESATIGDRALTVDGGRALVLVRVAQELVRNAVVHGNARSLRVTLAAGDDTVTMRVEDDGAGLSRERFERATGGLDNAVQWLREHGGALDLLPSSSEASKTTLHATLPRVVPSV